MRRRLMVAATAATFAGLLVVPAAGHATLQPDCQTYAGTVTICRSDLPQPVTDPVGFLKGQEAAFCEAHPELCTT